MIKLIHSRRDLLKLIEGRCPTTACESALRAGDVIVLGGFTPPKDFASWIVKIAGINREWCVQAIADTDRNQYIFRWPAVIPWEHWAGSPEGTGLIDGDRPKEFAHYRTLARREK